MTIKRRDSGFSMVEVLVALVVLAIGLLGIAAGGMIVFLPSPFWGWSPPQTFDEAAPCFEQNVEALAMEIYAPVADEDGRSGREAEVSPAGRARFGSPRRQVERIGDTGDPCRLDAVGDGETFRLWSRSDDEAGGRARRPAPDPALD